MEYLDHFKKYPDAETWFYTKLALNQSDRIYELDLQSLKAIEKALHMNNVKNFFRGIDFNKIIIDFSKIEFKTDFLNSCMDGFFRETKNLKADLSHWKCRPEYVRDFFKDAENVDITLNWDLSLAHSGEKPLFTKEIFSPSWGPSQIQNILLGSSNFLIQDFPEIFDKVRRILRRTVVPAGTILYHGSKTDNLSIDLERENYLYFTDSIDMARDYALYDYKKSKMVKRTPERKVFRVRTLKDLKMVYAPVDLTMRYRHSGFSRKTFYDKAKKIGLDGIINYEFGFYHPDNNRKSRVFNREFINKPGKGLSYYFFDLKNIEVIGEETDVLWENKIQSLTDILYRLN